MEFYNDIRHSIIQKGTHIEIEMEDISNGLTFLKIKEDFNIPIVGKSFNDFDYLVINSDDIIALGSLLIHNHVDGDDKRFNIVIHKIYGQDWSKKICLIGLDRKFFERNSFLFQGITRELHRDVKLSKILN